MKYNICVNGSRGFTDYKELESRLTDHLKDLAFHKSQIQFILGGAKGADDMAETYARRCQIDLEVIYPDWKGEGKKAGMLRNIKMLDKSDELVSFWDGQSKGTKQAIDYARKKGLKVTIFTVKGSK